MFKRSIDDPFETLNIGKIALIKEWLMLNCRTPSIEVFHFDNNLNISCNSYVDLGNKNLKELPDYINFYNIAFFDVGFNKLLKSTKGFPKKCDIIWINNTLLTILDIKKCCDVPDIRKLTA
jgi:hypothetical protein